MTRSLMERGPMPARIVEENTFRGHRGNPEYLCYSKLLAQEAERLLSELLSIVSDVTPRVSKVKVKVKNEVIERKDC